MCPFRIAAAGACGQALRAGSKWRDRTRAARTIQDEAD
jgi:hypothetical protein